MAAAAALSLLAGCSWLPSWLGGPPSRAVQPTELTDIKPSLNTRVAWRASVGASRTELLQPAVVENAVLPPQPTAPSCGSRRNPVRWCGAPT